MNEDKQHSTTPEADRAIATYGMPPAEKARQAIHEILAAQRETFRALTRLHEQAHRRLHEREDRER